MNIFELISSCSIKYLQATFQLSRHFLISMEAKMDIYIYILYKAACMLIRDTKSSRGFVIESPAQMTRLHTHIFSIIFLRCWHQTFQHFFNWKLNKDGFGLFRDSLGRSRLQVAVPKGLHKGGAIQRHGSVRSTAQSSPSRRFLLFQATKRA